MSKRRQGGIHLDGLDGPRERVFDLPDNWDELDDAEREAVWRPVLEQLMNDSVAYSLAFDGECSDCELLSINCECFIPDL